MDIKKLIQSAKHSILASLGAMNLYVPNPLPVTEGIGQTLHQRVGAYNYCSMNVIAPTWALTVAHCGQQTNVPFLPGFGRDEGHGLGLPMPPNYPTYTIQRIIRAPDNSDMQLIEFSPPAQHWIPIASNNIQLGQLIYFAAQGFGNNEHTLPHIIRVGTSIAFFSGEPAYHFFCAGYGTSRCIADVDPPPPNPTPNEAHRILHDSGGGMFAINPITHRLELYGIMNSGADNETVHCTCGRNVVFYRDWINQWINSSVPPPLAPVAVPCNNDAC